MDRIFDGMPFKLVDEIPIGDGTPRVGLPPVEWREATGVEREYSSLWMIHWGESPQLTRAGKIKAKFHAARRRVTGAWAVLQGRKVAVNLEDW